MQSSVFHCIVCKFISIPLNNLLFNKFHLKQQFELQNQLLMEDKHSKKQFQNQEEIQTPIQQINEIS